MPKLDITLRGRVVAELRALESVRVELAYRPDARAGIDDISIALPVRDEPYDVDGCRSVLEWLLPERQVRATIAQRIHADASDTFALLAHYGRECAGAIQFAPTDSVPLEPSVSWLEEQELARRIGGLSTNPFLSMDEDDIELSLGGVQEKALVVVDGDRIGLPRHGAISTHIIKPDISDRLRSVLAEYFAMRLAREIGLSAAHVELRSIGGRLVLFVRRFDRLLDADGSLRREHQETCAQALDIAPERKYELRGGPGVGALATLLRKHGANPARDLQSLTMLIVFNALIGNADAHVGNFGLIHYVNGATRLAPAYDLLPYRSVLGRDPKGYAMRFGDSYEFGNVSRERVEGLARQLEVAPRGAVALWDQLRSTIPGAATKIADEIAAAHELSGDEIELLERITTDVSSRC